LNYGAKIKKYFGLQRYIFFEAKRTKKGKFYTNKKASPKR